MKIPKSVKIAGFVWKIEYDKKMTEGQDFYGCTEFASQTIYLDPDLPQQKKEQTFLHELMHAVFWQFGISKLMEGDQEEIIINASSFGLYHVLKDNGLLK